MNPCPRRNLLRARADDHDAVGLIRAHRRIYLSLACGVMDEARVEQAALIPFADDPDAAEQMARETGRRCETVVNLVQRPFVEQSPVVYLDA